jgi:chaperone modulatory protein CbpM
MQANVFEALHINPNDPLTLDELIEISGFSKQDISELVDCGALELQSSSDHWMFKSECIVTIKKAKRLKDDFELHPSSLVLLVTLLQQINTLENEIQNLRLRLPSH